MYQVCLPDVRIPLFDLNIEYTVQIFNFMSYLKCKHDATSEFCYYTYFWNSNLPFLKVTTCSINFVKYQSPFVILFVVAIKPNLLV